MILQALPGTLPPAPLGGAAVRVVVHDDIASVEAGWRRLESDNHTSLHHGLEWCRTWLATHGGSPLVVEGLVGEKTAFLLPLVVSSRRGSRVARFIGSDQSNLNTGLFDPELSLDSSSLRDGLVRALQGRADLLSLERMALCWRERISPLAGLPHAVNQNRAFQVPLFASFEDTLKQVNAKRRRKKFRLQQRRLEEAGGYDIIQPETAAERHVLLEAFFRQKAERFRSQGLPDVFNDPAVKAFFHGLLEVPSRNGDTGLRLHGLRLKSGEQPILAITGTSRKGDHVICQFGSIREDLLADASPGEFLFWHVIEEACRDGAAIFDFGIGDQSYKRSWCTVETVHYDVLLPLSLKGQVGAGLHRVMTRAKATIKATPWLYGAIQKFRSGGSRVRDEGRGEADADTGQE